MLSVARLGATSYALVCYLMNCLVAGVEEVVSSTGELSVLMGVPERMVRVALEELESCSIVLLTKTTGSKTLVMRFQLDVDQWKNLRTPQVARKRSHLGDAHNILSLHPQKPRGEDDHVANPSKGSDLPGLSSEQALMFPSAKRKGRSNEELPKEGLEEVELRRVLEAFQKVKGLKSLSEKELAYGKMLCESHPADQIVSLVEAFGAEMPSLSILAAAWVHYSERFHQLGQEELSLDAYRNKNDIVERKLRQLAHTELKRAQSFKLILSPEEELLLRIFTRHQQPRRQLHWALQVAERYPHLQDFFRATREMALKPRPLKLKPKES